MARATFYNKRLLGHIDDTDSPIIKVLAQTLFTNDIRVWKVW